MSATAPGLIVSVSGIRGVVGESLVAEDAARFAQALAAALPPGAVLVARDSRPSGVMLEHAVVAGLLAAGRDVLTLGILPTPTVGVAVRDRQAAGAVQITASHNPAPWNGLKLFGSDGAVLPAAAGAEVRRRFEANDYGRAPWSQVGTVRRDGGDAERHVRRAAALASPEVGRKNLRVLLDGNGGAGGPAALMLLNQLGVGVVPYSAEPSGVFVHEPEPIPAHLGGVAEAVRSVGVAAGFILDPDADRLALIDETGACVSEEATLALAVKYRLSQSPGPVVINMSTSRMSEELAAAAGQTCRRSAVGEANVVELMRQSEAVIGGEGNGGVIDPRLGWVRDPFAGIALILSLMAESGRPLSRLVAELPRYAMLKTKFALAADRLPAAFAALRKRWPDAAVNELDGLHLSGSDWWLHVRASNTEPVVRAIAEAPTAELAEELCREAGEQAQG